MAVQTAIARAIRLADKPEIEGDAGHSILHRNAVPGVGTRRQRKVVPANPVEGSAGGHPVGQVDGGNFRREIGRAHV